MIRPNRRLAACATRTGLTAAETPEHTRRTPYLQLAAAFTEVGRAVAEMAADLEWLGRTEVAEAWEPSCWGRPRLPHWISRAC